MIIDKRTITLNGIENKTVTILISRKNKNVKCRKGGTAVVNLRGDRILINLNHCKDLNIAIIPTNLKKSRVFVEPESSEKLRNILIKKYKRINN